MCGRRDSRTSINNHNGNFATLNSFEYLTDDSILEGRIVGIKLISERYGEAIISNFLKCNIGRNSNVPVFDLVAIIINIQGHITRLLTLVENGEALLDKVSAVVQRTIT